jgi:ferrous iron transport protein B
VGDEAVDLAVKLKKDPDFTAATALSMIFFVLLYIPCIATISVFKKETGSWKWVGIYTIYSLSIAWVFAFVVFRIAMLFGLG